MEFQPKPLQWSFSRWRIFNLCRKRYWGQYLAPNRRREEQSPAAKRGDEIHKLAQGFLEGKHRELAPVLSKFRRELYEARKQGATAEEQWAFNRQWQPVGWFAEDVWLRIKTDLHIPLPYGVLSVVDLKTGKVWQRSNEYIEQLTLYAAGADAMYEGLTEVEAALWFIDHHVIVPRRFVTGHCRNLRRRWTARAEEMERERAFAPMPSKEACRYCPLSKHNGGDCQVAVK